MKIASEKLIDIVLTCATAVHRVLRPGLLESVYERALMVEFETHGICAERQKPISVRYRDKELGIGFRADVIVEDQLLLELKCIDCFKPLHVAQIITYLKLLKFKRGYLINFNHRLLKNGIKRISI